MELKQIFPFTWHRGFDLSTAGMYISQEGPRETGISESACFSSLLLDLAASRNSDCFNNPFSFVDIFHDCYPVYIFIILKFCYKY